jgi:DNA-binding phage protein
MAKTKTSTKRKTSSQKDKKLKIKDFADVQEYSPTERLLDKNFIGAAILECLSNNDPEGVMEIIEIYLDTLNKTQMAKKTDLARSTMYHSLKGRNPTVKTLAKLVYASTH